MEVAALVLAESLLNATDGVHEWQVGPKRKDLMGSIRLPGVEPKVAIDSATDAMVEAVRSCGNVRCAPQSYALTSELFTTGGKIGACSSRPARTARCSSASPSA